MELKSPVKKGYRAPGQYSPLPICKDASSAISSDEYDWPLFTGQFNGSSVIVDDPNEMVVLSRKGCFGKGSLSRGCPRSGKRKILLDVISESQWKRRKQWSEKLTAILKEKKIPIDSSLKATEDNEIHKHSDEVNSKELNKENNNSTPMDIESNEDSEKKDVDSSLINKEANLIRISEDITESENNDVILITDSTENETDEISSFKDNSENKTSSPECVIEKNTKEISTTGIVIDIDKECKKKPPIYPFTSNEHLLGRNEVLVIADLESSLDDPFAVLNPRIEKENIKTVIEVLYLSLEEAFFLSYALNCLQVIDLATKFLSIKDMWMLFQQSQLDFIEKYVAYHYFRAKGWIVKSGLKFGGDFLLYKMGPQYFHASYIVIIELFNPDGSKANKNCLTWEKAVGVNRMAESATKEILLCQIQKPNASKEMFHDPSILKDYKVQTLLLRKWKWQATTNEKE